MPRAEIDIEGGIGKVLEALERASASEQGAHVLWIEPEEYTRTRVECALEHELRTSAPERGLAITHVDGEGDPARTIEALGAQIIDADPETLWGPDEQGRERLRALGRTRVLEKIAQAVRAQARHLVIAVRGHDLWALRRGHGERLRAACAQGRLSIVGTRTRAGPWTNAAGDGPHEGVTFIGWDREEVARAHPTLQRDQDLEDLAFACEGLETPVQASPA